MAYYFNGSKTPMTERDEWRTPPGLVDYMTDNWYINFDLFATDENAVVGNGRHFTQEDDALNRDWPNGGSDRPDRPWNFANPPFSLKEQAIKKAISELYEHKVRTLMILPLAPETGWFMNNLCKLAPPGFYSGGPWQICFPTYVLSPRVPYLNKHGIIMRQPPFVTCIVAFNTVEYSKVRWLKWKK